MPSKNNRRKYALTFLLGGLFGVGYLIFSVFTSASSTAAIGLLFLPLYFLAGAIALAIPAAALFTSFDLIKGERSTNKILLAVSAWALIAYTGAAGLVWKKSLREARDPNANEITLKAAYNRWLPFGKLSVQLAAAENPAAGPAMLQDLWENADASLKARILENPRTPPAIMESVAESLPDYFLQSALARNPALTQAMMAAMVKNCTKADAPNRGLLATYVLAELARRKDLPNELLRELLSEARAHPAYFLVYALVNNEEVTCEEARKFLGMADNLIEREVNVALQRKNCR